LVTRRVVSSAIFAYESMASRPRGRMNMHRFSSLQRENIEQATPDALWSGPPSRDDLGLVSILVIETGHLAAGKVVVPFVIGDADTPIREVVGRLVPEALGHHHRRERPLRLRAERSLAIGEDVEALPDDLGKARRAPASPVKGDGRVGIGTEQLAYLDDRTAQFAGKGRSSTRARRRRVSR
jgi:hypothetical protein